MNSGNREDISVIKVILSSVGLILFWSILTDAWGYSEILFGDMPANFGDYLYGYISRLIWVIPSFILIIHFNKKLFWNKQELFPPPKFNKSLLIVLIGSLFYCIMGMFLIFGGLHLNKNENLLLLVIKFLIVGIVEETAFRGWVYNALRNKMKNKNAVIVSSLLFSILHWPAYFIKLYRFGNFDISGIITQSIFAFITGIIFCALLKKGKSIWNPIIAHCFYDTLCILLMT